jgi:hypothetical protein
MHRPMRSGCKRCWWHTYAVAQVAALCTGGLFGVCSNSGTCSSCKADEIDAVLAGGALPATRSWEQTPPSSGEQPLEAEAMYVSCDPQLPLPASCPPASDQPPSIAQLRQSYHATRVLLGSTQ